MSEGMFKKSVFGGFNRQDVLDYIDKLEEEAKKSDDSIKSHMENINDEKEQMVSEFYRIVEENKILHENLESGSVAFNDLKNENRKLANEYIKFKNVVQEQLETQSNFIKEKEQLKNEIEVSQKNYEFLTREMEKLKKDLNYYMKKSSKVDKINENIGEIVEQTKNQNSFLLGKAYEGIFESSNEAKKNLQEAVFKLKYFQNEVSKIKEKMEEANNGFLADIDNTNKIVENTISGLDIDGNKTANMVAEMIEDVLKFDNFKLPEQEEKPKDEGIKIVKKPVIDEKENNISASAIDINNAKTYEKEEVISFPFTKKSSRLINEVEENTADITPEKPIKINDIEDEKYKDIQQKSIFEDINFFSGQSDE